MEFELPDLNASETKMNCLIFWINYNSEIKHKDKAKCQHYSMIWL